MQNSVQNSLPSRLVSGCDSTVSRKRAVSRGTKTAQLVALNGVSCVELVRRLAHMANKLAGEEENREYRTERSAARGLRDKMTASELTHSD